MLLVLSLLAAAPQGAGTSSAPVVINEICYENWQNPDFREFVEIYNRSGSPVDIGNWHLDAEDWQGAAANNQDFFVPPGTILAAGDYYVFGAENNTVANTDQICVVEPSSNTGLWENGDEGLMIRDSQGTIIDAVYWESHESETGGWVPHPYLIEGQGIWGSLNSLNVGPISWQRYTDGYDTDNNGRDFRLAPITPGTTNDWPALYPYTLNLNGAPGDIVGCWASSFERVKLADPAVASQWNPAAIPLSPAGSNRVATWQPRGNNGTSSLGLEGGTAHCMMLTAPAIDIVFEAYVYLDLTPEATDPNDGSTEGYAWSLGVQGHSDGLYGFPDVHPTLGTPDNGDTGITLTFVKDNAGATLYLIDHNDGGLDHTILGQMALQVGVHDGWQRVRLQASASWAEAHIGGTYGAADGAVLSGPIEGHLGGVYVSHMVVRKAPAGPLPIPSITQRPFTVDALTVKTFNPGVEILGSGTANTVGTPSIATTGYTHIGNASFSLVSDGLVGSSPYSWLFDFPAFGGGPIDLSIIGAPSGATLWAVPDAAFSTTSDPSGEGILAIPLANEPALLGGQFLVQAFQIDGGIPASIPISHSPGVRLTFVAF